MECDHKYRYLKVYSGPCLTTYRNGPYINLMMLKYTSNKKVLINFFFVTNN